MKDVLSADRCAAQLKALADSERLRIVQALRERPQSVSDLAALLDKEIGIVSHHLKVLRKQRLVANKRMGKTIIYSLSASVFVASGRRSDRLELGCCCLEIPRPAKG